MLALMGATETGRVEVAALADRRVNLLLAFADTDRDAAISQAEADAMQDRATARMHGRGAARRRPRRSRAARAWRPAAAPGRTAPTATARTAAGADDAAARVPAHRSARRLLAGDAAAREGS